MLQKIRNRISGWIAGVVIALVASAFILFGIEYYFEQSGSGQDNVAVVNGVSISHRQFNESYSQLEKQTAVQMGGASLTNEMKQQIKSYALQSLITQTALKTTLMRDGFHIGLPQVKAMISGLPQFQDHGKFSEKKLMLTIYQMGVTPEEFFAHLQTQWLTNQALAGISNSAFALPNEVSHQYALSHQQRAYGYFIIPSQKFLSTVHVSDADVKNNYTANQVTYQTPAKVSVAYLELSPTTIQKNITVTPAEVKTYYDEHVANYRVPAQWDVSQITVPVTATASPADIQKAQMQAKAFAADIAENKNPGVKSQKITLSALAIDPALREILTNLHVGKTSMPLRTANGFTVLTLLKTNPETTKSFDSVKNTIHELLVHQRVNQILSQKSSQLADLTYTNPDSLDVASKTLDLPIQTTPMMTKSGEKTGLFANPTILAAVFSESVFQSGNNSGTIGLKDGTQIVLRIMKKNPSQSIPFSTVSAEIKKQLEQKQAIAQAGLLAYQLQKQLAAGVNPDTLAAKNHLQWHAVSLMTQAEKSSTPASIVSAAFSIKPAGSQALLYNAQDYAVILVLQAKNADVSHASAADQKTGFTQLSGLWGQLLQHYFVESVMADSKIKITTQ